MTEFTRRDVVALVLLTGLAGGSWLPRLRGPIDLRWDCGTYYVLGTSLAQGHGYRLLNEPGEILETHYPPLLPIIVAAHQLVLGTSDFVTVGEWLRRSFLLLFVAYAIAVYAMLRRFLPLWYAVPAALVCLLQIDTIFMSDLNCPDIPFGLVTILFVLCSGSGTRPARRVLRGTLAMIAFALRTVGVSLLAAWVCDSLCRRDFKQMGARMLIAGAVILGWAGYIASVESSREYQTSAYGYQRADYNYINVSYAHNIRYKDPFSPELGYSSLKDKVQQFVTNIAYIPVSMGEAVTTKEAVLDEVNRRMGVSSGVPWLARATLLFLGASVACGIGLLLLRRQYFISLYLLFSLAMVCATPWPDQFNRYLTPLAPFLSLSFFLALRAGGDLCARGFPARSGAVSMGLAGTVAMSILACQAATLFNAYAKRHPKVSYDIGRDTSIEYRLFFYENLHRATDAGLDWLRRHANRGAVLATTDPAWAYLRTGLKSVIPPFELDARKAQGLLDEVPVRYLVVDEGKYKKYTTRVVAEYPDRWRRVFADAIREEGKAGEGTFEIYERIDAR